MLHTDRPSSAEYDILSAEEETPVQLWARLYLMSDGMSDHFVIIALPTAPRACGRSLQATTIVNERPLGLEVLATIPTCTMAPKRTILPLMHFYPAEDS